MRKIVCCIVAIITVCATLLTALALTLPPPPSLEPKPINIVIGEGELRVEVDKDIYRMGETVQIRVFQKNLRNAAVQRGIGHVACIILDSTGHFVDGSRGFFDWLSDFVIPPMEEVELKSLLPPWRQTYNRGGQVPLGRYTIQLELDGKTAEFEIVIVR